MHPYIELTEAFAAEYRRQRRLPVIGITGSVGKTTIKELTACILSARYCVHKSEGSCNGNAAAVRNTLSIQRQHQVCVFELGIDDVGQMERMVQCCRPTIPILTGICEAHLEKLKTPDMIYREKSHIFDTLPRGGKLIANGDDAALLQYLHQDGRIVDTDIYTYGLSEGCMLRAEGIETYGLQGSRFRISGSRFLEEPMEIELPLPGLHMVQNAVCAAMLGILFDVPQAQLAETLKTMPDIAQRCQRRQGNGITVIDDTYNASPASVKAALQLLGQMVGRRVCILGDMDELGAAAAYFHEQLGAYAARCADEAVFVGTLAEAMYAGALREHTGSRISWYPDKKAFLQKSRAHIAQGDTILVKASHRQEFSALADAMLAEKAGQCLDMDYELN